MRNKSILRDIVIMLLCVVIGAIVSMLLLKSCKNQSTQEPIRDRVSTSYDTIYKTDTFSWTKIVHKTDIKPYYIYSTDTIVSVPPVTGLFGDEDEGESYIDLYGSPLFYTDTARWDGMSIVIDDTIQGNRILDRVVYMNDRRPTLVQNNTIEKAPRKEFPFRAYLGVYAYVSKEKAWGVGPSALLTTRFGLGMMYSYDVHQAQHTAGVYYMLKFKKNKN